ncbi:4a-hydroxytetrahydrobiopterin dehydratase [Novosphingobium sp. YAF33]|uniref:4a-hydroxytetrahydrobiopterin dehydratase n=1 Tax=Novosphingobium sp. YAF33 TaxID=3233082 RepID=UPI003F9B9C36
MTGRVFINYRWDDTAEAAQAIFSQLSLHFSISDLFMDTSSIESGQEWPARIRDWLLGSRAMLCLIGRNWLFLQDTHGRRRIDSDEDWVRREIEQALAEGLQIYPILIDNAEMPEARALPTSIRALHDRQAFRIGRTSWMADLRSLVTSLEKDSVIADHHSSLDHPSYPNPAKLTAQGLSEKELSDALQELDGWQPWSERILREYPFERTELRRTFGFRSFRAAIKFMDEAVEVFTAMQHHPRWGNEWRVVHIRLTTWDAGNKITRADIEAARAIDALVQRWRNAGKTVI